MAMIKIPCSIVIQACQIWLAKEEYQEKNSVLYEAHKSTITRVKNLAEFQVKFLPDYVEKQMFFDHNEYAMLKKYLA